jgi:hypothetical protein
MLWATRRTPPKHLHTGRPCERVCSFVFPSTEEAPGREELIPMEAEKTEEERPYALKAHNTRCVMLCCLQPIQSCIRG